MRDATVDAGAARKLAGLIEELSSGTSFSFDWSRFEEFRYRAEFVQKIFEAAPRESDVVLGGEILGDVRIDGPLPGDLILQGHVEGSLLVAVPITGQISLGHDAVVRRDIEVTADASGIHVGGRARVQGRLALHAAARVQEVSIHGDAAIGSIVLEEATITGALWLDGRPSVSGDVQIVGSSSVGTIVVGGEGKIGGRLLVAGDSKVGNIYVSDGVCITDDVDLFSSSLDGDLDVAGCVGGSLRVGGHVEGRLVATGRFGALDLRGGTVANDVTLTPKAGPVVTPVTSLVGARFDRPVHLGNNVSIVPCDFRQCGDLDKLDLVGADLFTLPDGSQAKELVKPEGASDGEMASIYRQLRVNLEGKGNRPASAFFYRGEMDSRRRAARQQRRWGEWAWLSLYRLVAGYGLRVAPPLLWFAALVGLGGVAFHLMDLGQSWPSTFVFTAHSMLSLFRPPEVEGDWAIGALQIVLRILGPVLLGLAALAVRDKVAR